MQCKLWETTVKKYPAKSYKEHNNHQSDISICMLYDSCYFTSPLLFFGGAPTLVFLYISVILWPVI